MFLGRKIFRAFCSQTQYNIPIFTSSRGPSANKHLDDVLLDQMIKGFKKAYTDRFLLDFKKVVLQIKQKKLVIPAKRVRSLDDHIVGLWKKHEVAVVIEGRDEFEDIDIVLDYYQVAAVKRRICANVAPIYIRIPGHNEDIRCTLGEIIKDPKSGWPFKVTLRRYIVGRPNLLYVPIALLPNNSNPALVRGTDYDVHIEGVWINSYILIIFRFYYIYIILYYQNYLFQILSVMPHIPQDSLLMQKTLRLTDLINQEIYKILSLKVFYYMKDIKN